MEYEYFFHASRTKKVWITCFKNGEKINDSIWVRVELNIVDNDNKINYMMIRHPNYKEEVIYNTTGDKEKDLYFINNALKFAKDNKYLDKICNKYKIKL